LKLRLESLTFSKTTFYTIYDIKYAEEAFSAQKKKKGKENGGRSKK
jgi:hypothetical protein